MGRGGLFGGILARGCGVNIWCFEGGPLDGTELTTHDRELLFTEIRVTIQNGPTSQVAHAYVNYSAIDSTDLNDGEEMMRHFMGYAPPALREAVEPGGVHLFDQPSPDPETP